MEYKQRINTVMPDLIRHRLPLYIMPRQPEEITPHPGPLPSRGEGGRDCSYVPKMNESQVNVPSLLWGEGTGEGVDDRISIFVIFFALSLIIFGFVVESELTEFSDRMFTE